MRVQLLDPSAFTPPYDRALAAALARAGHDVELVTSRFLYGPVPEPEGYRVREAFYRRSARRGLDAPGRRVFKAAEHLADMARMRRSGDPGSGSSAADPRSGGPTAGSAAAEPDAFGEPDIVHHQWFTFPWLDSHLIRRRQPQVFTAHYILPPHPGRFDLLRARETLRRMDAVIAHTEHGAQRLKRELRLDPARIHVIPHGVFDYLTRVPDRRGLPHELEERPFGGHDATQNEPTSEPTPAQDRSSASDGEDAAGGLSAADQSERPIVLFFGLLRPYKGIEVLLETFRSVPGAELWIAGNPRMDVEPLREAARQSASPVRFAARFISDAEIPALLERADLLVLPYLDVEQSGVLYTALAFGKPMILSSVGGFPEVAERTGAAALVPPGDPVALARELNRLVGDAEARGGLAEAARAAAGGEYSWDTVAARTTDLYRQLLS